MIARITGTLVDTDPTKNRAFMDAGQGLTYEVLLPAYVAMRLAPKENQTVTLHTLCFFESTAQGATLFPRLAGFLAEDDKRFFELFVTVKGIGHRRALRAMVLDPATLASAIADRDVKLLQTMPEVGKKLAETIIVTLKDKIATFVSAASFSTPRNASKATGNHANATATPGKTSEAASGETSGGGGGGGGLARDALEILLQLGEQRLDAVQLIDRVLIADDPPTQVQALIEAVYRLKAGA